MLGVRFRALVSILRRGLRGTGLLSGAVFAASAAPTKRPAAVLAPAFAATKPCFPARRRAGPGRGTAPPPGAAGTWRTAAARASGARLAARRTRSEEHTSELQSLMRISYAVFCLK